MENIRLAYWTVRTMKIPDWLPFEDAENAALWALESAQRKKPHNGEEKHATKYLVKRIQGGVYSAAGRFQWFPRRLKWQNDKMSSLDEPCGDDSDETHLDRLYNYESVENKVADRELIQQCFADLSSYEQEILYRYYVEGYTHRELSKIYNVCHKTCCNHINSAVSKAKERLGFA